MKTISTTAIVALMTASIGLGAVAPALAQETSAPTAAQTQPTDPAPGAERGFRNGPGMRQGGGMGGAGLFNLQGGAEAIEIAIVRLSHAIDLTDEQTVLLEALKTDALAAAAAFEAATADLRPAAPAAPAAGETPVMPDMSSRFENRIAMEKAQLAALEAVQPAFTAFFDSLTDEQKAALTPEHGPRNGGMGKQQGGFGPGQHGGGQGGMGQHGGQHGMGPGKR